MKHSLISCLASDGKERAVNLWVWLSYLRDCSLNSHSYYLLSGTRSSVLGLRPTPKEPRYGVVLAQITIPVMLFAATRSGCSLLFPRQEVLSICEHLSGEYQCAIGIFSNQHVCRVT